MNQQLKATKTNMYKLIKDFAKIPMPKMCQTEFKKHRNNYLLVFENYSCDLSVFSGIAILVIKQWFEDKEIQITIPYTELETRNMVK